MLSPEPNSPPPRRRRRRAKRKAPPPPPANAPSPDLATAFHGLAPPQNAHPPPPRIAPRAGQQQCASGARAEGLEQEVGEREGGREEQQGHGKGDGVEDALPTPALRRPGNPVHRQLDLVRSSSSSSSSAAAALAAPPPAQAGPSRIATVSTLTPLSSRSTSSSSNATAGPVPPSQPFFDPVPAALPDTLSPATRLRSRRGSTLGRVPDPQWAANVLEPIARADAAEQEKARKDKGKGKERERGLGWQGLQGGSAEPSVDGPLSTDEFILNVLPKTTLKKAKKQDSREVVRSERSKRGAGRSRSDRKGKGKAPLKRQERPRRDYTSSEEDDTDSSARSLLDPADFLPPIPTPKPLFRMSTFLGGAELDAATSKEKERLLRRAPYATPGGGKDPLSFDTASRTAFGKESQAARLPTTKKRKRRADDEGDERVKRLPPGKDVRAPFISSIGQTAFAPLATRRDEQRHRQQQGGMKTLGELEDEVDRIAQEAERERRPFKSPTRRKAVTLARPGGGKITTLELGAAEEAGAVAEQNPRLNQPRPPRKLQPTVPSSRKPSPSSHLKLRFTPRRLPPPRRLNPLPALSPIRESAPSTASASLEGAALPPLSSRQLEKAKVKIRNSSSSPPAQAAAVSRTAQQPKQTDFRFVTGCKAKKAPTVEVRHALAAQQASARSSSSTTGPELPSPQAGQSRPADDAGTKRAHLVETVSPRKRKRTIALVTPAPANQTGRRADSDPEGDSKRKKHCLLRRLSTRPGFQLPTSPAQDEGEPLDGAIHFSSHEYGGAVPHGRSHSLPPEFDSRPSTFGQDGTSPSRRPSPFVQLSPELFADAFPPAHQTDSLPAPSGYVEGESPSFLRQAVEAAEAAEGFFHNEKDEHEEQDNRDEQDEGDVRDAGKGPRAVQAISSSSADSPLLQRRRLPSLPQPNSTQTSGIWSHVPSFPSRPSQDAFCDGGLAGAVGRKRALDPFSVDPDDEGPSHVSPTPEEGSGFADDDDDEDEQQPPTSLLDFQPDDEPEGDGSPSAPSASGAGLAFLPSAAGTPSEE
ncbi:hypothetical protein JCM6882_002135 [Rhodosporidiobolus microsporus]